MDLTPERDELRAAEMLVGEMQRLQGHRCRDCSALLCSHQVLMNIVLGFSDSPRCLNCVAFMLSRDTEPFRDYLIDYLQQWECHRTAWAWANRNEAVQTKGITTPGRF